MVQFEYKVIWFNDIDSDHIVRELDHAGSKGWELVSISQHGLYLKRVKTEPTVGKAVRAVLTIDKGDSMPGSLTVDSTGKTATLQFVDDKGDTDAAPPNAPDGTTAVITFVSDNTAVASIAADPANPLVGDITLVAEGTFTPSVTVTDSAGNPIMEADGVTPFSVTGTPQTVSAGAAATDELVLN